MDLIYAAIKCHIINYYAEMRNVQIETVDYKNASNIGPFIYK